MWTIPCFEYTPPPLDKDLKDWLQALSWVAAAIGVLVTGGEVPFRTSTGAFAAKA